MSNKQWLYTQGKIIYLEFFIYLFQNDGIITNLELDSNALRAEGARYIMEMLKTNTTIESLVTSSEKIFL